MTARIPLTRTRSQADAPMFLSPLLLDTGRGQLQASPSTLTKRPSDWRTPTVFGVDLLVANEGRTLAPVKTVAAGGGGRWPVFTGANVRPDSATEGDVRVRMRLVHR